MLIVTLAGPFAGSAAPSSVAPSSAPPFAAPAAGSSPVAKLSVAQHSVFLPLVAGGSGAVRPPAPSSQELILNALSAGTIDRGTALLYRAYAMFGDPRLPAAFVGSGPVEDAGLMAEAADPTLSPAVREALRPFTVRPTDPASIFSIRRQAARSEASLATGGACADGWVSDVSATAQVRVWAECVPGLATDPAADAAVAQGIAFANRMWGPMTALMGPPIPDLGTPEAGGDSRIDIYIVNPLSTINRGGGSTIPNHAVAVAPSTAPCNGQTCSGYMLLNRTRLGTPDFYTDMVHEFFHILQNAHNAAIAFRCPDPVPGGCAKGQWLEYWFVEASAVWAESYFAPETAADEVHSRFTSSFQPSHLPLHISLPLSHPEWSHIYGAYIWPYFMQQIGGPGKIADAWKAIAKVDTWAQATDAIDTQLPFERNFRTFAVRNYNRVLLPGDPLPRQSRYVSVEPFSNFPDNSPPPDTPLERLSARPRENPYTENVTLAPLSARYYHYAFDQNEVQQVIIDATNLKPAGSLDVDAFVLIDGKWSLRSYQGNAPFTFCLTNPAERLEEIVLVLSNHDKNIDAPPIEGLLKIFPLGEPCGCEEPASVTFWDGHMNFAYNASATSGDDRVTVERTANVSARLTELSRGPGGVTFIGELTGTAGIHDAKYDENGLADELKASGAPLGPASGADEGAVMKLSLDFLTCRYNVSVGAAVLLPDEGGGGPVSVGSFTTAWRPLGELATQLTGGGTFPAHSALYLQQQKEPIDAFHHGNFWLEQFAGETGMGAATVSWNVVPPPKP